MSNCAEYQGRLDWGLSKLYRHYNIEHTDILYLGPGPEYSVIQYSESAYWEGWEGLVSERPATCCHHVWTSQFSIIGLRNPPAPPPVHTVQWYSRAVEQWTVPIYFTPPLEAPTGCTNLGVETGIEMLSSNQICIFGNFQISLRTLQHDILNILLVFSISDGWWCGQCNFMMECYEGSATQG